jgi:hypothetical protein
MLTDQAVHPAGLVVCGNGRRSVVWTESARGPLDDVVTYIAQDSHAAAARVLDLTGVAESDAAEGIRPSSRDQVDDVYVSQPVTDHHASWM